MFAVIVILLALICLVASDAPSASTSEDPGERMPPAGDPPANSDAR